MAERPSGPDDRNRTGLRLPLRDWMARAVACFPERQIYVRSKGRVLFYTLSRGLQAAVAGLSMIFLAWAALSTVRVVFKDRIIAAEDHRFQMSQAAFEARIADLQISYDDLMGETANAQAKAERRLAALVRRQDSLVTMANTRGIVQAVDGAYSVADRGGEGGPSRPTVGSPLVRILHWLGLRHEVPRPHIRNPSLVRITEDVTALEHLSQDSNSIMGAIEAASLQQVAGEKALIAQTGIDADQFLRKLASVEGVGGPEISLDTVQLDGVSDRVFSNAYFRSEANVQELAGLQRAMLRLPTAMPLGSTVERTSGFGPRLDPLTGAYAFHPGIDFAGPTGAAVLATANGIVTFAGRDGGYGNMVEIDHGFGLKTRYAHLLSMTVLTGQRISKGVTVGHLGSSGRSTGPHVHYEVWYDDKVRNPDGFLRVGTPVANTSCMVIACSAQRR